MSHPLEAVEEWRERAAIMEYDGGLSRADAEKAAADRVTRRTPARIEAEPVLDTALVERMRQLCLPGGRQ